MTCDHCGHQFEMVHGFVYADEDAHALYHAILFDQHPNDVLAVALSLGDWAEEASAAERYRVAIEVWSDNDQLNLSIRDGQESPWQDSDTFGRFLTRDEALQAAEKARWFHVLEHVLRDDSRIARFCDSMS